MTWLKDIAFGGTRGDSKINNQDKTITENGTYTADEEYSGFGTVIVAVNKTESSYVNGNEVAY